MKFYFFLICIFCSISKLSAQFNLINEQLNNSKYTLFLEVKDVETFIAGSNEYFQKELFISIPENDYSNIDFEINDFVILPQTKEYLIRKYPSSPFLVKGVLDYKDSKVLHISVLLYSTNKEIRYPKQFKVTISHSSEVTNRNKKILKDELTINGLYNSERSLSKIKKNKNFTQEYLKVVIAHDDIYRLNYEDLKNFSIVNSNPKNIQVHVKGSEIPIYLKGEEDNSFDDDDYIEFVSEKNYGGKHLSINESGESYNEYLNRYTDSVYLFITWNNLEEGLRVNDSFEPVFPNYDTLKYYKSVVHSETNNWFDFPVADVVKKELPYWSENKTWIDYSFSPGIRNISFQLNDIDFDQKFECYIKVFDNASDIFNNAHHLAFNINQYPEFYDSTYLDKYEQGLLSANLASSLLQEGNNTIKLNSFVTEANLNSCKFDWAEIHYPRKVNIVNDSLKIEFFNSLLLKNYNIIINNISLNEENFIVWNLNKTKRGIIKSGNNNIGFSDEISKNSKYFVRREATIKKPIIQYYKNNAVNLISNETQADYILITHKNFSENSIEYLNFIENNYSIKTTLIDIDDIYDQFSNGFPYPESIKNFLKLAYNNWKNPKPKFVFLMGASTYDYYNNRYYASDAIKEKAINYVPSFGAPVSDNWFVIWDTTGANIPQMNIGRLPVKTNEDFEWYFEKHRNYVTQEYDEWNKKYLFFSGGNEKNPSELNQLNSSNQFVIDNYANPSPIGGKTDHFYKTISPNTNFGPYTKEYFDNSISDGGVFISYIGHSGTQTWDNSIISPAQLKNDKNRYPIVSDFGCSTAKFAEPDVTSFSQLFTLDKEGQALGYIGNSSLGFLSTSLVMPKLFYKKILNQGIYNVSEAHKQAKIEMLTTYGSSGVYELFVLTNTLIGDPIISLPVPQKPNFVLNDENILIESDSYTDLNDKIEIGVEFFNYGKVVNDTLNILLLHTYLSEVDSSLITVRVPKFSDKITNEILIKDKPGQHSIQVLLDSGGNIDEIYENDNSANLNFYVASSKLRSLFTYQIENGIGNKIKLLNPILSSDQGNINLEYSQEKSFLNKTVIDNPMDSLLTDFELPNLEMTQRYWFRTKRTGSELYSSVFSANTFSSSKFLLVDSTSYESAKLVAIKNQNNSVILDTSKINFKALSAGFSDGNTVLIEKNLINYVFDGTLRGHYVSVFKDSTFEFINSKVFDLLGGGATKAQEYSIFLDTVSVDNIVIFAIKDEGGINLSSEIREKIKGFGSKLIDSVAFRGSWTFFGKKGLTHKTLPEAFSNEGDGYVEIDTTITFLNNIGSLTTRNIGPSTNWENLSVRDSLTNNSKITYKPILISQTGNSEDTLAALNMVNGEVSLSFIDAEKYPHIKILAEFEAGDNNTSPELYSLGVDYFSVPELAINYQVVSVEKDTVQQGEDANLQFYVYNVGESTADSFKVTVDVVKPDNSKEKIFEKVIDSLGSEQRKKFNIAYPTTNFNGQRTFAISIDTDEKVHELYEDNNFYNIPFYVVGDTTKPTMNLTFDGNDIFDGEYISSQPKIKIELSEPSLVPITDTSSISIFLNNRYVNYSGNENNISASFSQTNPKVTVNYTPNLEDGEYTLRVFGKDASGNVGDSSGISKSFNVQSEAKLLNVYNYPNPFNNDTYFTFKLTQIPDDIRIKVFTIAGRLIKEIELNGSQLNYDLNKIYWDGRDDDGDLIGNGVYLYKVIMDVNGKKQDVTQKLAIVR